MGYRWLASLPSAGCLAFPRGAVARFDSTATTRSSNDEEYLRDGKSLSQAVSAEFRNVSDSSDSRTLSSFPIVNTGKLTMKRIAKLKNANKKRMYVVTYGNKLEQDNEERFLWAILVGPKHEKMNPTPGRQYGAVRGTEPPFAWKYHECDMADTGTHTNILTRVLCAKIEDEGRFHQLLRETPIERNPEAQGSREWVKNTLQRLARDENHAVGRSELDWNRIEYISNRFADSKVSQARYTKPGFSDTPTPTWSLFVNREVVP